MRTSCILILILIWMFTGYTISAQDKTEVEKRVNDSEVPSPAQQWIKEYYGNKLNISWYEEMTSGKHSYEAKFKWKGKWHSVEFDDNGVLEDIEINIKPQKMPSTVMDQIDAYFQAQYSRYKIMKIQEQWTGRSEELKKAIHRKEAYDITVRYEIEYYGKSDDQEEVWEGLFDAQGEFIQKRRIVLRPTDNLLY